MKLVPKEFDEYNPIVLLLGAGFVVAGSYMLLILGVSGPLIVWLLRAIPGISIAMGLMILIRQFQLRRRRRISK